MRTSNKLRQSKSDIFINIMIYAIGTTALIVSLYPVYFTVIASFSDASLVNAGRVYLYPRGLNISAYKIIFKYNQLWTGYKNTIFYVTFGTIISVMFTLGASYSLSRKDFKLRNAIMLLFVITMFFNGGLIPTYLWIRKIGLYNTRLVMLIPFSVNIFNIIVTRTFMQSNIPDEILDAAKIDGASNFRFFFKIVLPLTKPIIAVITLYYAVAAWNGYFDALIYLRNSNLYTLQLILRSILILNEVAVDSLTLEMRNAVDLIKYGMIVVSTIPIMCLYPFVQKYFTKGVMIGAIKG